MKGTITSFRRSRHRYKPRQFIIKVDNVETKTAAEKFIGKEVVWKSPAGKEIKGKLTHLHGNKGLLRALFEKGLPGQAVAQKVEIK
ncbi:50S ribosomal protein L35ae [Candidatus Pacearchaeota archaeon ex4484_26]|nr:MAG: 50S ribosomal protein L35ae [Candidatus Pacearchaeota archaeon ex4484_26]